MRCIRVGRRHTFYRALDLLTSCACTDLSAGASTTALPKAARLCRHALDFKRCRLEGMKMLRPPLPSLAPLRDQCVVLCLLHRRTIEEVTSGDMGSLSVPTQRWPSLEQRRCVPPSTWGQVLDVPRIGEVSPRIHSWQEAQIADGHMSASSGAFSFILSLRW